MVSLKKTCQNARYTIPIGKWSKVTAIQTEKRSTTIARRESGMEIKA